MWVNKRRHLIVSADIYYCSIMPTSVDEIMRAAEVCRARTIMRSYLEALSP